MKIKLTFFIVFSLFINANIFATTPEDMFVSANYLFKNKKYNEALKSYIQLEKSGIVSSSLYENIGYTYANINNIPLALVYFEKAKKYSNNPEEINSAISNIVSSKNLEYDYSSISVLEYISKLLKVNTWIYLSIILTSISIILIAVTLIKKELISKTTLFTWFIINLFLVIGVNYLAYYRYKSITQNHWAIIIKDKASLKNTPNEASSTNYEVVSGSKFEIKDKIGNWYLLQNQFSKKGWVNKNELALF